MTTPTRATREQARRLLCTIDAARGHLAAALRDPHSSDDRIAEAVRRAIRAWPALLPDAERVQLERERKRGGEGEG